jgi:hypothetical protein
LTNDAASLKVGLLSDHSQIQTGEAAIARVPDQTWMAAFGERVSADLEMRVAGAKFFADFSVTFDETRYVLQVREGRIERVLPAPRFDVRTQFGIRAPMRVWSKFLDPEPPPMFHDFFALLMRVPEFILDGDTLIAMQNARALHRMMNVMREVGPIPEAANA